MLNGTNRTGSGSLDYTVALNGGVARAGIVTIAGQTFTVSQSGFGGTPTQANALVLSQFVGGGTEWNTTLFVTNLSRLYGDFHPSLL